MATTQFDYTPGLPTRHQHREVWLANAVELCKPLFTQAGYTIPGNVRVGAGWPSKRGLSKQRRIGEAWSNLCSKDQTHEIIISVYLDDPVKVLGVLVHELIHVTVGVQHMHKKPFTDAMKALGLEGPPTATTESPQLLRTLREWVFALGRYVHASLDGLAAHQKQSTRLLLMECECGLKIRVTRKWMDVYSDTEWPCPCGGQLNSA